MGTTPVRADTLEEAIAGAYTTNPELAEARARQLALQESLAQARAEGRPTISAELDISYDGVVDNETSNARISLGFPLWTAGRVRSAVRASSSEVAGGGELLREREAEILEQVVTAYGDLLFAQEAVKVAEVGIERLNQQIVEARLRFDLGEATLTDVAQLRTQKASVVANLADAKASLEAATAAYRASVGREPAGLDFREAPPRKLPPDLPSARTAALAENPLLQAQSHNAEAAGWRLDRARAERRPFVDLNGTYGRNLRVTDNTFRTAESESVVGVTLTVPISNGGLLRSRVREAEALYSAERFGLAAEEREVLRQVETQWAALIAALERLDASQAGLEAADLALIGVQSEYQFGLRSTIDLLIAEQSYRDAQLAVAASRRDVLVTQASILRTCGRLDRLAYADESIRP